MKNLIYKFQTFLFKKVVGPAMITLMAMVYFYRFRKNTPSREDICKYFCTAGSVVAYGYGGWFRINNYIPDPCVYAKKPVIIVMNHVSFLDYYLTAAVAGKVSPCYTIVYGVNLEKDLRIVGNMLNKWFIPIDRPDMASRIKTAKKIIDALNNGWSVVIFPEGTRMTAEEVESGKILNSFYDTIFEIAKKKNIDILPVCIHKRDFSPKNHPFIKPGIVPIDVLPPAVPSEFDSAIDLMNAIQARMTEVLSGQG